MNQQQWVLSFIFIALMLSVCLVLCLTGIPSWRIHGVDLGSGEPFYVDVF